MLSVYCSKAAYSDTKVKKELTMNSCNTQLYYLAAFGQVSPLKPQFTHLTK